MTVFQNDNWLENHTKHWIKAPSGKVLKVYLVHKHDIEPQIEHGILDEYGTVFVPGYGGWSSGYQGNKHYRIIPLPNPVEKGNDFKNNSWRWEDWWEKNWQCDSWAWCYMKRSQ